MRYKLLGVEIDSIRHTAACERVKQWLKESPISPKIVFTPNPEIITYATTHPDYQQLLNTADLNLPDGIGIVWLSQRKIQQRLTGTDILQEVMAECHKQQLTIGVVLRKTGLTKPNDLSGMMVTYDRFATVPDVVMVALGFPDQEYWVRDHLPELTGCRLVLTVGGGVDFFTGKQKRAPLLFQRLGLEWLWRLIHQPWRWRRIVTATLVFPYLVFKQRWFHV